MRVAPRVFLAPGHPWTDRARIRSAGLWAGERAAVSGPAAAWWYGMLARAPDEIEVTVPRGLGLRSHPDVRVRRRDLAAADLLGRDGIWLTDIPLTTPETAIAITDGSALLDRALQKHVRFEQVYRAYCRNLGPAGSAAIGQLLVAAADRADSAAERLMVRILRGAGVTGWTLGHRFGPWMIHTGDGSRRSRRGGLETGDGSRRSWRGGIDKAFPASMVAIEVDGWAWHVDVERFRADRHKSNAPANAGWHLLRFTWHDLTNRPDYVLGEIRAALAAAA
jgi:hypothetical protein